MQVHSVECQLAQAQMNLYLAGDTMAEETVAELERHITGCESCRQVLRVKKQSLQSMLKAVGAPDPAPATTRQELRIEPRAAEEVPDESVPAALRPATAKEPSKSTPTRNWKPVYYSGALALVLGAMSFMGDPTRLFGAKTAPQDKTSKEVKTETPKVADTKSASADAALEAAGEAPDDVLDDVDAMPMSEGSERPVGRYAVSMANADPDDKTPAVEPTPPKTVTKHVTTSKAVAKPKSKPKARPARTKRRAMPAKKTASSIPGGLKVYDEAGKPIKLKK
ncbi:MAG TPA: zf-HC2 domain-containing protein [Fimbriimonadaceae bacterium]|nr:zf-HC2 domain-containing protein [Fimbriimonadaceae bacterium]HRJ95348.1 zf-HC2 domain-containing protein [Fimbriimonadaceae bacterium]